MSELKLCPMCGAKAESRSDSIFDPPVSHPAWTVTCSDWKGCGLKLTVDDHFVSRERLQQEAEDRWNKRG